MVFRRAFTICGLIILGLTLFANTNAEAQSDPSDVEMKWIGLRNGRIIVQFTRDESLFPASLLPEDIESLATTSDWMVKTNPSARQNPNKAGYESDSKVDGHTYLVSLGKDSLTTFTDLNDNSVVAIPGDIMSGAAGIYDYMLDRPAGPTLGFGMDSDSGTFSFNIQNTLPIVAVVALFLEVLFCS